MLWNATASHLHLVWAILLLFRTQLQKHSFLFTCNPLFRLRLALVMYATSCCSYLTYTDMYIRYMYVLVVVGERGHS